MGNKKSMIAIIAVIVVVGIGATVLGSRNQNQPSSGAQIQDQGQIEETQNSNSTNGREFSARFLSYSEENLKKATQNAGKAVVFFHAGWCPTCQAAEKDLSLNFDKVPKNVTILKTDYDTSENLKKKYGVVMQDTWVQVDAEGKEITKWNSGGEGVESLLENLK